MVRNTSLKNVQNYFEINFSIEYLVILRDWSHPELEPLCSHPLCPVHCPARELEGASNIQN